VNRGQEFVIGGYTPSLHGLDTIIVGYYNGNDLIYVARVRNGLVPPNLCRSQELLHGKRGSGTVLDPKSDTPRKAGGLVSGAASKAVTQIVQASR